MLPNPILRHIYNNSSDDVIRRGKKIFHTSGVTLQEQDLLAEKLVFRVRNDIYNTTYRVTVNNFTTTDNLNTRCPCPYNMGIVCKHEAAALLQLNELLQSGFFENVNIVYDQSHTLLRMRNISEQHLTLFTSDEIRKAGKKIIEKEANITIISAQDDVVNAEVKDGRKKYKIVLAQNAERYFETTCVCEESEHPMCVHKFAVFQHLLEHKGANYFSTLRNWDNEKNKLLALYGFSLEDELRGKFEFAFIDGKLTMRVLNTSIKKLSDPTHPSNKLKKMQEDEMAENEEVIIIIGKSKTMYPFIDFKSASAIIKDQYPKGGISYPSLPQINAHILLRDEDKGIATAISKLNKEELVKALKRDLPFGDFVNTLEKDLEKVPNSELRGQVWDYYWPKITKLFDFYKEFEKIYVKSLTNYTDTVKISELKKVKFSESRFKLKLTIAPHPKSKKIQISSQILLNESVLKPELLTFISEGILYFEDNLYAAENSHVCQLLQDFPINEKQEIAAADWNAYLENVILKLDNRIIIAFHDSMQEVVPHIEPVISLQIRESEDKYVFLPVFTYNGIEKKWLDPSPAISAHNGKIVTYPRNEAIENTFLNTIKYLHPNMLERRKLQGFAISVKDALKRGWYFEFIDLMKEQSVEVTGFEQLKHSRINPNKPIANIQFTTGIDWFSAKAEVRFGDQLVGLADLKKAISKNENTIKLKDGSRGLITEEFLEEYGLLFKMGKIENDEIKISKIHFSTIEHLKEVKENDSIFEEIEGKKRKLMQFDYESAEQEQLPDNLNAELRPYQKSGFQWMGFLHETGWGGILADDMGLGKTVQTLSALIRTYNMNPKARFLVACPTTLLYNWENESKKFTPDMSYHIYHGPNRKSNKEEFETSNLIITTYGTLRSDIEMLSNIEWDYVVLDESQAIKNPMSQASKAALRLNAKNRLALSGTPIQNNTFDLYAQMNFLNPGMLGSIEFFKNEFAVPIDKNQDEIAKEHLKKLIYPFLLRRTKEQVAPDLPEKTETVLYCEMGKEQRKIYESYRHQFRSQILGSIEDVGMERSQMSILTGLMKLRQICDSPAILKGEQYPNASVKIEELIREISENVSNHKALVFSQFLGMLDLIRQELEKLKIPYVYFDGSTSGPDREKAINRFQEDGECKVFLISLKAGGVGLNLTAADYVYIVDPWWNPAVEQQAIDRTHRIGQTKNIFAYRMICKDTIEEKILLLQSRKIGLAKELISEDTAFLKKLTIEDVEFLLS